MRTAVAVLAVAAILVPWNGESNAQKVSPEKVDQPKSQPARVVARKFAAVTVLTGVSGADVRLEQIGGGRRVATARTAGDGGATFEGLAPGRYRVVATAPDCGDVVVVTVAKAGHSARVDARLVSLFGTIVLGGAELGPDVRILVDGGEVANSRVERSDDGRVRIRVEPGERDLVVEAPRRVAHRERVSVTAGEDSPVAVALPLVPGRVRVKTTPGAIMYVDDSTAGAVPSSGELLVQVDADVSHRVRIEADDFEPFLASASAAPGAETLLAADLTRIPTSGPFGDAFVSAGLELWEAPAGWAVEPKRQTLVVSGSGVGLARKVHYEDFELVFNFRILDGTGVAWVVRGSTRGAGYVFVLAGPKASWPNQLRVYEMSGGRFDPTTMISAPLPVIPDLVVGESYSARVRVEGNTVRTWLRSGETGKEVSIGNFVDADRRFRTGGLGFAGLGGRFEVNGVEAKPLGP